MLYARFRTIMSGEEPGDPEEFIYLIEHGDRKVWVEPRPTKPERTGKVQQSVRTMIASIDAAARRERGKEAEVDPVGDENDRDGVRGSSDGERDVPAGGPGGYTVHDG